jgi:alpha-tubulin suppressor-like RCC1 family protein
MRITRRDALKLFAASPLLAAQAAAQPPASRTRRVVATAGETFLIEPDGSVLAWSYSDPPGWKFGLGNADRVRSYTAYPVPALKNARAIASGDDTAYALMPDGTLMAWGGNFRGQLGATPRSEVEGTAAGRATAMSPVPVLDVTDAIDIAAHDYHALAVTRSGQLWVWGYNLYQQLGIEMPVIKYTTRTPAAMQYLPFPMPVPGLTNVVAAATGARHSLVLLRDGTLRAWGTNTMGQVGDGTTTDRRLPVRVVGVENAVRIVAFADFSAALLANGTVMTWGYGGGPHGRSGPRDDTPCPTPTLVRGATGIRDISMGGEHMVALTTTGTVVTWGHQRLGERGHPGVEPAPIPGLTNVVSIAAYTSRTMAVLANGTIMTLGWVPYWARLEGGDRVVSTFPIPLVIRNLKNPM